MYVCICCCYLCVLVFMMIIIIELKRNIYILRYFRASREMLRRKQCPWPRRTPGRRISGWGRRFSQAQVGRNRQAGEHPHHIRIHLKKLLTKQKHTSNFTNTFIFSWFFFYIVAYLPTLGWPMLWRITTVY